MRTRLHPAADLHGPRFKVFCFAGVDFIGIDQQNKHHECADPDPASREGFDRSKHGEKAEREGEEGTERREEEIRKGGTLGIAHDSGFEECDCEERNAKCDSGSAGRYGEPQLHGGDDNTDEDQDDTSLKLGSVSRIRGNGVIVSLDAASADNHG